MSMRTLDIYRKDDLWCFDDEKVGLKAEPFFPEATACIDYMLDELGHGFRWHDATLTFSQEEFPDATRANRLVGSPTTMSQAADGALKLVDPPYEGGCWYGVPALGKLMWLCDATLLYFNDFPKSLYAKVEVNE